MRHLSSLLLITALTMATALPVSARQLSPDQALAAARQSSVARVKGSGAAYQLAYSHREGDLATIYVFTAAADGGFMVTAADDAAGQILLGYSDTSSFDPDDIPQAMRWWIDNASLYISQVAKGEIRPTVRAAAPAYTPIEPLCKTQWNQGSPYNNFCPVINGRRSVTGCVATAMAQVMKYHNKPVTGEGSMTVNYTGTPETVDFGATTYQWDNMLNVYRSGASTAQKNAVATLMYHCGVASSMQYSPDGSGTSDIAAGIGLINHLRYNPHMTYQERVWYTADDWDALVYDQLEKGQPLMYCGNDGQSGHAFVCDGYSADRYFHINWGWGGVSDGYFLLSDLNPYTQGIGGGSGQDGFNYGQSILLDMTPNTAGLSTSDCAPNLAFSGIMTPQYREYTRADGITMTLDGDVYSYALGTVDYDIALRLDHAAGNTTYIRLYQFEINPLYGFSGPSVNTANLPVGSYDVSLVCRKVGTSQYVPVHYLAERCSGRFHLDVTEDKIVVSGDHPTPRISVAFDGPESDELYLGHTYTFDATINTNCAINLTFALVVTNSSKEIFAVGEPQKVNITDENGGSQSRKWTLAIPPTMPLGTYYLAIGQLDKDGNVIGISSQRIWISVQDDPAFGSAAFQGIIFVDSPSKGVSSSKPAIIGRDYGKIQVHFKCDLGPWSEQIYAIVADRSDDTPVAACQPVNLTLETGESGYAELSGFAGAELDVTYHFIPMIERTGDISTSKKYYVKFVDDAGVDDILTDTDTTPAQYFNLQGIRMTTVDNLPAGCYIKRQGSKTAKVVIR